MKDFTVENLVQNEIICLEIFFDEMIKHGEISYDDIENLTDTTEFFVWYRISELLYKYLKKHGEVVYKYNRLFYFWGRRTCGQAISEDSVIQEIFAEIYAKIFG